MPIPKLPAWIAAQIGLGVANALIVGYRSYERLQFIVKSKIKVFSAFDLQEETTQHPIVDARGELHEHGVQETDRQNNRSGSNNSVNTDILLQRLFDNPSTAIFYLKPEPDTDKRIIHVFNNQGEKVYVLLRPDIRSQTWTLAYADARMGQADLATIYTGKQDGVGAGTGIIASRAHPGKYILFNNPNGGLTYRKVSKQWTPEDGNLRVFYLSGAAPYHWNKSGLLQKSVFSNTEFFLTDPSVESPATIPLGLGNGSWMSGPSADRQHRFNAFSSPSMASLSSSGSSNRSGLPPFSHTHNSLWDLRPGSTGPQMNVVDRSLVSKSDQRETIAHAGKVARGMVWRIAIDTSKVSPEIVIATGWISILHQWSNKVTIKDIQLPEGI
ncbi:hypothetical protein V1511DRAFT_339206 [Dipodascopsis uninucleata]